MESKPISIISDEERQKVLCDVVRKEGVYLFNQTELVTDWKARVQSVIAWRKNEDWPNLSDQHLLNTVEDWLAPYLNSIKKRDDFFKLDFYTILSGLFSWEQIQLIDKLAPAKIKVPSGSMIALNYKPDGISPVLAVRLQEVFGLVDTPTVNEGKIKVLLHLLSPGYKPVQITQDLKSFWENTYPEVRKELKIRYKRHHWPEDPWTAEAVSGAKRR